MMKDIKKEVRQSSLIHDKIRNSGFVPYGSNIVESFKNHRIYSLTEKIKPKLQNFKRSFNSITEKPRLWFSFIDGKEVKKDLLPWFFEVIIEGIVANWWTHKIFGLDFGVGMIIAHGFLIKQGLDIYQRLMKHGNYTKISKKNN